MPIRRGDAAGELPRAIIGQVINFSIHRGSRAARRLIATEYPNDDADNGPQEHDPLPQPERDEYEPVRPEDEPVGT